MLRRLAAEFIGTAMLLAAVVGSGIMAERLAGGNVAVALLANTLATGAALLALIFMFARISGAHFNPVVTLVDAINGGTAWFEALLYSAAQILGALLGTALAILCSRFRFSLLRQKCERVFRHGLVNSLRRSAWSR
jgi:glycerol uptake facilitator-like aquaporin